MMTAKRAESETPRAQLVRGLADARLTLPEGAEERLLAYVGLLGKWNQVYNLTALRDESRMVSHHLLDSLALLPKLGRVKQLADIGSGGGLPGIPLAIARPDLDVALVESNRKKSTFLEQARIELQLANVTVHCIRAEAFHPTQLFEVVVSRAFSDLAEFVRLAGHLLAPSGALMAMKGLHPYEEIAQLPSGWHVEAVEELFVPGVDAVRHLVKLVRDAEIEIAPN